MVLSLVVVGAGGGTVVSFVGGTVGGGFPERDAVAVVGAEVCSLFSLFERH